MARQAAPNPGSYTSIAIGFLIAGMIIGMLTVFYFDNSHKNTDRPTPCATATR